MAVDAPVVAETLNTLTGKWETVTQPWSMARGRQPTGEWTNDLLGIAGVPVSTRAWRVRKGWEVLWRWSPPLVIEKARALGPTVGGRA